MNKVMANLATVFLLIVLGSVLGSEPQPEPDVVITKLNDESNKSIQQTGHNVDIYKGNSTTMNTHRYLVVIKKNGVFQCAGTIVSQNWVLTTADCTFGSPVQQLTAVVGSTDGDNGQVYQVSKVVEHPEYGKRTLDYEYSCVQVVGKFYYWAKRSHLLPTATPVNYTTVMAAGYGYTSSSSTKRELREAEMTWLPKDYCQKVYKGYDFAWTDRMACANNVNQATLCGGDYGDSFIIGQVVYGQFIGVAKSGFCTDSSKPVIVSDISVVADWIQSITGAIIV